MRGHHGNAPMTKTWVAEMVGLIRILPCLALLPGCGDEARSVVACFPNCEDATIQALAACDAQCVQDGTAEASPPGLSDECVGCTGATVACGAAFCTAQCVRDTNAQECIDCRCDNGCTPAFDVCTGLPSSGDCD